MGNKHTEKDITDEVPVIDLTDDSLNQEIENMEQPFRLNNPQKKEFPPQSRKRKHSPKSFNSNRTQRLRRDTFIVSM